MAFINLVRGIFGNKVADRHGGASVDAVEGPEGTKLPAGFLRPGEFVCKLILVAVGRHLAIGFDAGPHLQIFEGERVTHRRRKVIAKRWASCKRWYRRLRRVETDTAVAADVITAVPMVRRAGIWRMRKSRALVGFITGQIVGGDWTTLSMIGDRIRDGFPYDEVRHAGLFAKARLCEIGNDKVSIHRTGFRRVCRLIDDEGGEEGFLAMVGSFRRMEWSTGPRSPTFRRQGAYVISRVLDGWVRPVEFRRRQRPRPYWPRTA